MTTNREGRRFESCRARSKNTCKLGVFLTVSLCCTGSPRSEKNPSRQLGHEASRSFEAASTRGFACTYSRASNLTRESNKSLSWSVTDGEWWSRGLTVTMSLGRMSNDYLGGGPAGSGPAGPSLPPGPHVGQCQCNLL